MSAGPAVNEARFLIRQATWQDYVSLRDADENRTTRMTFDRGRLEFMSPTRLHERIRILVGHCLLVWFQEMCIPFQSCGSMINENTFGDEMRFISEFRAWVNAKT